MLVRAAVASAMLVMVAPVAAADLPKGVYLRSEDLCAQARKESLQAVIEAGNAMLSARGIDAIEYNCEFVQVTRASRIPTWLVDAVCQEPDYIWPDVLTVTERTAGQLDVVSVKLDEPESGAIDNGGTFFLCEGLTAP
jgi:hypothetical protein